MAIRVQVLDLTIIRPLVRHIEGGTDGTSVWIDSALIEQIRVQLLVQVIDRIVEGQEHYLGYLFDWKISGNIFAAAETVGQQTHILSALGGSLVWGWSGINWLWS